MRSRSCTTADRPLAMSSVLIVILVSICSGFVRAQSVAIVTPYNTRLDKDLAENTRGALTSAFRVQDLSMADTSFTATGLGASAFNMTTNDARNVAAVVGCDFCVFIKSGTQRRASVDRADYFESFAAFYIVSGRTGRLVRWQLVSEKGENESDAERRLIQASLTLKSLSEPIADAWKTERNEPTEPMIEEIPEAGSPAARNFRSPVPYKRFKPEYTRTAYLYDITATVEATVDLDEKGQITRLEITRWAGYDLDESVVKAIRSMNWRQAERNGKPLPIRFLLRYNFKKIEKDDTDNE